MFKKAYKTKTRVRMMKDGSDKFWLEDLRHPNESEKNQGKIQISIEMIPAVMTEEFPAGLGRSEPNMNPVLPPPEGRLEWVSCFLELNR